MAEEASLAVKHVVEALATGFKICINDLGEYDGYEVWIEKREGFRCPLEIEQMFKMGIIERHPTHAHGYRLTDAWHKTYLRSTDELGDGKLYAPDSGGKEHGVL